MAVNRARLAATLSAIVAEPVEPASLPGQICRACLETLPIDGVGISLMAGHKVAGRALLGASDATGQRLEELQFNLGEGPCATAFATGQPVLVPDLAASDAQARWPMFIHGAETTPAKALFAFPLQLGAIRIGAMDCYRTEPGSLNETTEALVVAEAITMVLLQAQTRNPDDANSEYPEHRADSDESSFASQIVGRHAHVHQATGMISAQLQITPEEAFVRLRAYAYQQGMSLDELGTEIVTRRLRFPDDPS